MSVLLVTFDCLPRRWLGCYGSLDSTTRGFDRLASRGIVFDTAVSEDVRLMPAHIAGLRMLDDGTSKRLIADGTTVSAPCFVIEASSDTAKPSRRRSRSRPEPGLARELHSAVAWLREQPRADAIAWVRHPGVTPESPLRVLQEESGQIIEQLALLDAEFDEFIDEWMECAAEDWTLIVTAARGVLRTGATSRGIESASLTVSDDLIRVPLLMLAGRGAGFGVRDLDLRSTTAIATHLARAQSEQRGGFVAHFRDESAVPRVVVQTDAGRAIRTPDWLFAPSPDQDHEPGEGALFRKPEDACDIFDVRTAEIAVAIDLDQSLQQAAPKPTTSPS